MARKNNLETTIAELLRRQSAIESKIGEDSFSAILDMLVQEAKDKNQDYNPKLTSRGRPGANLKLSDLIKENPDSWLSGAGIQWDENDNLEPEYSFIEICSEMCEELGYSTPKDVFKLGIILSDLGLLNIGIKMDFCNILREITGVCISKSTVYKGFAKLGMANDKDEYIEKFFPKEEREEMRETVETWLCYAIEEGGYEEYQSELWECVP